MRYVLNDDINDSAYQNFVNTLILNTLLLVLWVFGTPTSRIINSLFTYIVAINIYCSSNIRS